MRPGCYHIFSPAVSHPISSILFLFRIPLSFTGLQSVVSQPMFFGHYGKRVLYSGTQAAFNAQWNQQIHKKNITIYPRNKICKREIEFQISLYVLIIQEKQKKNSVRAIILRYRDVGVHFNGHSKNQWRHTENTVRINATNNNAFIEYNSLQLLCDLIFFSFFFIIECPC